jgi:hypothetical protein
VAGSKPKDAVKAFVEPIQDALGCFVDGKVSVDRYDDDNEGVLTVNRGDSFKLRGPGKLSLTVSMRYRLDHLPDDKIRGPWKVHTSGWMYRILNAQQHPIIEYHWHPISDSHERRPHAHVANADGAKPHIPTGRVMIEDVLHCALQYGAIPRAPAKWRTVETGNRAKFLLGATWGMGPAFPDPR